MWGRGRCFLFLKCQIWGSTLALIVKGLGMLNVLQIVTKSYTVKNWAIKKAIAHYAK